MENKKNNFLESLKVSDSERLNHNKLEDRESTEALYLYTNNSLDDIVYFLRDFYNENPTQETIESGHNIASHAESYYYSLRFELSHAYIDFLDGNMSIQDFKNRFDNLCSHYKTNPLTIYKTHNLVIRAKEKSTQNECKSIVNSIEIQADDCWKKMKEDKENER